MPLLGVLAREREKGRRCSAGPSISGEDPIFVKGEEVLGLDPYDGRPGRLLQSLTKI